MASEAFETEKIDHKGWLYHPVYPNHWNQCSLYSMARWVNGLAFRDIQFSSSGMPVIKIAEIKGGISTQTKFTEATFDESVRVRPGDLLFSWSGQPETSIDAFWWRGPEGWLNQHVFRVTPAEGLDNTFFYYLLRYLKPNFVGIARNKQTTGLGHVTKRDLESMKGGYPSDSEQRAIAHILGTLDDKIENLRRQSETQEAMARALFKAWFVDFEPVRAKAEGRWLQGESLPGMPAHLYDLFPDRFVELELDEIPDGWEITTLAAFAALNPESWTKRTRTGEIRYVDLSNTKWGRIDSVTNYEADDAPSRAQRVLRPLDTIVGTVRPGNGSYALVADDGLTGSTGFAVLRPLRRECSEFVYLAATSRENIERLSNLADGGAYPAVRPEIVSGTQVPRAGQELINEFSKQVSPMLAGMADNERTSQALALLRDTLLPKLISGDLRIQDAEEFLKRANP
ncbi:MAG: restriction endonuclease subunit S [Rhodocyclales bacterium]|nr:restriction endonuclease subunit S [Rhodocyclales bacterium]